MSNHKDVLRNARLAANQNLAEKRIAVLETKNENDELGIPDDYEVSLKAILKHYGKPLALSFISEVLPDSAQLMKVRKRLRAKTAEKPEEIEEYKDGDDLTRTMIKLLPVPEPEAAKPNTSAEAKAEASPA
jgi:hypothetical protein